MSNRRLIIRPGAIGDFIVSLPALEWLQTGDTEVWTTDTNVPLVRFGVKARSLYSTRIDVIGLPGHADAVEALHGFDSIVSWYGANRPEFREAVAGLPVEFHQALPPDGCGERASDFYLRQVGAPVGAVPRLACPADKAGFAVIHPFSGGRRKNWPLKRFEQLARRLDLPVEWTAGPEETLAGARRFGNLWDLAQWLATARLYIGNDSGISHLAAAVGTPVVAIFGPTDPKIWTPGGPMVRAVRALDEQLSSVTVEEVLEAIRSLLPPPASAR